MTCGALVSAPTTGGWACDAGGVQVVRAGLTFDVRDEGPRDGEPVVLLHGFPQTSVIWTPLGARLRAAGYRTLAPDQRGYSPGARPRGSGRTPLPSWSPTPWPCSTPRPAIAPTS